MNDTEQHDALYEEAKRHAADLEHQCGVYRKVQDRNMRAGRGDEWEDLQESLEDQIRDVLAIDKVVTWRVTLGTGGPAYGVDYDEHGHGRAWHQDWFTPRVYADLDSDTADTLASLWAVGDYDEGFHND